MKRVLVLLCISGLLMGYGCTSITPITPENRTVLSVKLPDAYSVSSASASTMEGDSIEKDNNKFTLDHPGASVHWWHTFNSDELNRLINDALFRNFDINASWARLRQAQASKIKVDAGRRAAMDFDHDYTYRKSYDREEDGSSESVVLGLGLAAGYEVDLWGRLASKSKAARLTVSASREDIESLSISIAATIAENWVDLLAVRNEIRVLQEQIETNRSLVSLVELRFAKSMATALDVAQQRETLASTEAEMPLLKAKERRLLNTLSVLAGMPPGSVKINQEKLPSLISLPKAGIPSDLLMSRPDIRAAALRLKAADWEVVTAKADRLPAVKLSVGTAVETISSGSLFADWITTLAVGLTGPIFDNGSGEAEVARARAVAEERIAAYGDIVLTALQDVEAMMINESYQEKYIERLEAQSAVTKDALLKARVRFLKGQSDYFPFVSELLSTQRLERTLVRERAARMKYRIGLYRALGKNWTE